MPDERRRIISELGMGTNAKPIAQSGERVWRTRHAASGSRGQQGYVPGQASFSGLEGQRVGNQHFCGEHTSVDFRGYMNGGAESGERVTMELSEIALGRSRRRPQPA